MTVSGEEWQRAGGTMSDKTARKEFGLTQTEIVRAIREGNLQYRRTSIYGNPWRIVETSRWVNYDIDISGPALLSITGYADRPRMFVLLAYVNCKPTKAGVSFTWEGAWEFDQVSGTGSVKLGKDGRLKGKFKIKDGDDSTFIAERTEAPEQPIPDPPRYRDKSRRW